MNSQRFWEVVQNAHDQSNGDMERKCEVIEAVVSSLSKRDAIAFSRSFDLMMDRAYSWMLWGAAEVIFNGPCSDDTFFDFRASLISRGRQVYESALSDPDSMADENFAKEDWFYEGYQYAVKNGVENAVGFLPIRHKSFPSEPSGYRCIADEIYDLFPRLAEKVGAYLREAAVTR